MPEMNPSCQVFLNGSPVMVPWRADCHYAARGALGIPRGVGVARELGETGRPDGDALSFLRGHEFHEGERYVTVEVGALFGGACNIHPDGCPPGSHDVREPWQDDPEGWKDNPPA